MKKIILASNNQGKIHEFQTLLQDADIELVPQFEFGINGIAETGLTFVENALIKARYAAQVSGLPAIADDSGLVVAALQGEPGIQSARYAGDNATSAQNMKKLLEKLSSTADEHRQAYFYCVLVLLTSPNDPAPLICEGTWHGAIIKSPRGVNGFGYDPLFYIDSLKQTAAELPADVKNNMSHRGKALQLMKQKFSEKL